MRHELFYVARLEGMQVECSVYRQFNGFVLVIRRAGGFLSVIRPAGGFLSVIRVHGYMIYDRRRGGQRVISLSIP